MAWSDKMKAFAEVDFGVPENEVLASMGKPNSVTFKKDEYGNDVKVCMWTRVLSNDFAIVEFTDGVVSHGILNHHGTHHFLTHQLQEHAEMDALCQQLQIKNEIDSNKAIRQRAIDIDKY